MPPNDNEPNTVSPQTPLTPPSSQPQPQSDIPNLSSPSPLPSPIPTIPSTPPTIPPKTHKVLMAIFLLIILVAVAFGAYYATRTTKTKTTSSSSSSPVIVQPASLVPALVSITKSGFVPTTIKVKVGQAVIWTNNDTSPHLVASDPYPTDNTLPTFNSKQALAQNDSYSYVFNQAGTFTYHDDLNPYTLKGTVIVSKS